MPVQMFVTMFQLSIFKFFASGPNYVDIDTERISVEGNLWQIMFFIKKCLSHAVNTYMNGFWELSM